MTCDEVFISCRRLVLSAMLLPMLGCGGGDKQPSDTDVVIQAVGAIADARSNPEQLRALFIQGSEPDEAWMEEANKYMPIVTSAEISGETATVTVEFEETSTGEIVRTQQWQCERIDGEWKIKDAPLK